MRGNGYVPLYVNPNFMKTNDWEDLAKMMKWARANQNLLLSETRVFGGDPKTERFTAFLILTRKGMRRMFICAIRLLTREIIRLIWIICLDWPVARIRLKLFILTATSTKKIQFKRAVEYQI